MPPIIGLTGGIASGKSLVARFLAELGAFLIDSDVLAREVVATDQNVQVALRLRWPQAFSHFGELNRAFLAKIIFANSGEREALNNIIHPHIIERIKKILAHPRDMPAVVVIPLLVEANLFYLVDEVWLVWCRPETQIERLIQRDKLIEEEAKQRLAAQIVLEEKLKYAKVIINNEGTPEETRSQVEIAWKCFNLAWQHE